MNEKDFKSTWKTGIKRYSLSQDSNNIQDKDNTINLEKKKYPNGIIPFFLMIIIFISFFLIAYFATKLSWQDSTSIAASISFLFNLIWMLSRTNFNYKSKYNVNKFTKKLKLDRLKLYDFSASKDYAINNINDEFEYQEYLKIRSKKTSILFYLSLVLHASLFLIFLLIVIFVK